MFWTLKVTSASTPYFCSTISSSGSTANADPTDRAHRTHSTREENERLLIAQRHHWIDFHGAPRGNVTGHGGRDHEQTHDARIRNDVGRAHAVEHRRQQPGESYGPDDSENHTGQNERETLPENHPQHVAALR